MIKRKPPAPYTISFSQADGKIRINGKRRWEKYLFDREISTTDLRYNLPVEIGGMPKPVGLLVARFRVEAGDISQAQLAELVGTTEEAIAELEAGQCSEDDTEYLELLEKIAGALNRAIKIEITERDDELYLPEYRHVTIYK